MTIQAMWNKYEVLVDMLAACESVVRMRISARTGIYPRYLLHTADSPQG